VVRDAELFETVFQGNPARPTSAATGSRTIRLSAGCDNFLRILANVGRNNYSTLPVNVRRNSFSEMRVATSCDNFSIMRRGFRCGRIASVQTTDARRARTQAPISKTKKPGGAGLVNDLNLPADSFRELRDLMGEPRNLPAGIVLVNDVALCRLHQFGLRARHRLQRRVTVAALDRFLDAADCTAHLGATRLIDDGAAGNLACRLLGGSSIGHGLNYPSAVTGRG